MQVLRTFNNSFTEKHFQLLNNQVNVLSHVLDVLGSMPDSYSPKYVEAAWYPWWEKQVLHSFCKSKSQPF
jgi:hypothetical protein